MIFFYSGGARPPRFLSLFAIRENYFDGQLFSKRKHQFFNTKKNKPAQFYTQPATLYVFPSPPKQGSRGDNEGQSRNR